ncbi:MAG: translational GTPase TypA, partial [Ignavibacterium sp.]
LDSIIKDVPAPIIKKGSVQMQITTLDYNDYVGRIGIGRVFRGKLKDSDKLSIIKRSGIVHPVSIKQLLVFEGLQRAETEEVFCGDICAIVGIDDVDIGDTITDSENPEPLPNISIDEPTISMTFTVNNSPFYGREGKSVTSRQIRERLFKELEHNVALKVQETSSPDSFKVSGRGILHLSVLVENMRREGFELQIREPKVIYKEIDGKKAEPIEVLVVDVPEELSGKVIELVGQRRGELMKMEKKGNMSKIHFHIPSRGIMGLRTKVLNATQGEAVMHHRFYQYEFFKGSINGSKNGVIISMDEGPSTAYAIDSLQDRGKFFIDPGDVVYKGQIIGEHTKENDIEVNIQRGKKLTNMRASGADKAIKITPAVKFSLEEALEYVDDDEMVEVTPKSIRLRKLYLDTNERKRYNLGKLNK